MNIPVLYEDNWLLVVNKPSGLLVIPTPKKERRTLTSILNDDLKERGQLYRLHPCHRLDKETSGLIIYAKGKSAQKKLMQEFGQKRVKKTYIAFLQGVLGQGRGRIEKPIEGRPALTEYRILERRKNFTIVEARPVTGRTNQLRVHFKQIGHPVVGESKFAFRKDFKLRFRRLCLHAKSLEFTHPLSGKTINLSVDLPKDLQEFLDKH
ncbi:MAG: RluA family pseudouridine synthase [Candidatus Omnitrophica bacterium]|nr:RluA family pseudouridine synthase [Candidatus Omnitrophota bacterium]